MERHKRWSKLAEPGEEGGPGHGRDELAGTPVPHLDTWYNAEKPATTKSLAMLSAVADLSSAGVLLHEKTHEIVKKRQNNLSPRQKAMWALYDGTHIKGMMENVTDKTKELQELFPAAGSLERALVDKETLKLSKSLQVLKDAIKTQDKTLASALDAFLKPVLHLLHYCNRIKHNHSIYDLIVLFVFGNLEHDIYYKMDQLVHIVHRNNLNNFLGGNNFQHDNIEYYSVF
ncbi:hypothetical protein DL768_001849 [Monosporascus sp. mg162]|nr:hypothetical protein DL768_001849 [Monosporascus sp. mg162]